MTIMALLLRTLPNIKLNNKTISRIIAIQVFVSITYIIFVQNKIVDSPFLKQPPYQISYSNQSLSNTQSIHSKTWKAKTPWDAPPPDFYTENATGSFQNCIPSQSNNQQPLYKITDKDSGTITISCHTITYKAPSEKIYAAKSIIVGILSAASGAGPRRRNYIRSTWASEQYTKSVFFLVAGPWEDIREEFEFYRDLVWIDEEEVYKGEQSVLTFKTISYFAIVHLLGSKEQGWKHAIKTDDDSYLNLKRMEEKLISNVGEFKNLHYYGQCPRFQVSPSRDKGNKWPVTFQTYPEPKFPLYCQGAGFGLSRELVREAVEGGHVANFRYIPFEDVSIGILVERCSGARVNTIDSHSVGVDGVGGVGGGGEGKYKFHATMIPGIRVFRANTVKERECVNRAVPMTECYKGDATWPPDANMRLHLIQHRVDDKEDMVSIHKSLGLDVHWVKTPIGAKEEK
jgi:hypothetical protein